LEKREDGEQHVSQFDSKVSLIVQLRRKVAPFGVCVNLVPRRNGVGNFDHEKEE